MSRVAVAIFVVLILSAMSARHVDAQGGVIRIRILDDNRSVVTGAEVNIRHASGQALPCAESNGDFTCTIDHAGNFTVEVRARGFSPVNRANLSGGDIGELLEIVLSPATVRDEVVIAAARTETRLGETPLSIISMSKDEIAVSASPALDDTLRQVAGFSTFRRSSSRYSNPTTQGVSLRGVGASGASRSLVLLDNVPINDPFGGWVQWARVPAIGVERAEVLRGGASSLYGNSSLSGVVNLIERQSQDKFLLSAEVFGRSQNTLSGSAFTGVKTSGWTFDAIGSSYHSKGYRIVDESARGIVDVFSGSRSTTLAGRAAKKFGDTAQLFFKPSVFGEVRTNGTGLQTNRTHIRQFIFGGDLNGEKLHLPGSKLEGRVYGGTQVFDQIFSAVNDARTSENLIRVQRVPAQTFGFTGQFAATFGINSLVAGIEAREVRGASNEIGFFGALPTSVFGAGGRERTFGIFVHDFVKIGGKLILAGGLRFDSWKNFRALSSTRTLATSQTVTTVFPDRKEDALSPQISLMYQATAEFSVFATASRSFRAPTLNELYRGFRVGNVVTQPNEDLRAERADNFEGGISFGRNRTYVRGNFFWTNIRQPIANVTINSTPTLITRQRQNAGRTRARGFELEAETTIRSFRISAGYLFVDSRVVEFPSNRTLEGLRIPQVPAHQFTFQARHDRGPWTAALQMRASGEQFDDDLNLFRLEPYLQLDLFGSRKIGENLKVFAAVENLFDSRYSIGKTPIETVSAPLNFRMGLRWK